MDKLKTVYAVVYDKRYRDSVICFSKESDAFYFAFCDILRYHGIEVEDDRAGWDEAFASLWTEINDVMDYRGLIIKHIGGNRSSLFMKDMTKLFEDGEVNGILSVESFPYFEGEYYDNINI